MKFILGSFVFLAGWHVTAKVKAPVIKSWKIFRSDVGYQFKYPNCWKIEIDNPDESGRLSTIRDIFVHETPACATTRLAKDVPNGMSFSGGWGRKKTKSEADKEVESYSSGAISALASGDTKVFKKFNLGPNTAIGWVEFSKVDKYIRWHVQVLCPDWWISVTGPMVDEKNIPQSLYEKFDAGHLALPEPEKTVINSIRCIPAKQKEDNEGFL